MWRERQEAERARLARLEVLGALAEQAVAHLAELRDLAAHRKERAAFDTRLADVVAPYATSVALQRRLKEKRFV